MYNHHRPIAPTPIRARRPHSRKTRERHPRQRPPQQRASGPETGDTSTPATSAYSINGHMHHMAVANLDGTPVLLLINGYDIAVVHATTGEIIRTLTINPERRYHGTGKPPADPKDPENQTIRTMMQVRTVFDVSRHSMVAGAVLCLTA